MDENLMLLTGCNININGDLLTVVCSSITHEYVYAVIGKENTTLLPAKHKHKKPACVKIVR